MRIIDGDEIRVNVAIQLTVQKPYVKRAVGIGTAHTIETLADLIVSRVFGGTITVKPDYIDAKQACGKFGIDEPHPFPDLIK